MVTLGGGKDGRNEEYEDRQKHQHAFCRAIRTCELREPVTLSKKILRYARAFMFHTLKSRV
jgi:hypothetical protein